MDSRMTAGYSLAGFSLAVNALLDSVGRGAVSVADARMIITNSRSMIGSLDTPDPADLTAADGLLSIAEQMLSALASDPPPSSSPGAP